MALVQRPTYFELHVFPDGADAYGLDLRQTPVGVPEGKESRAESLVRLTGLPLRAVIQQVLQALKRNSYHPTELDRSRSQPFLLQEEDGVRLGLVMLAVKPMSRTDRIESVAAGIRAMEPEEAYYWFSKCVSPTWGTRAQSALRTLLTEE